MGKKFTKDGLREEIIKNNPGTDVSGLNYYIDDLKEGKKYSMIQFQRIVNKKLSALKHKQDEFGADHEI